MSRFCLLVADAARARIYTVEPCDPADPQRAVELHERADLIDNERRHPPADLVSDSPGTGHAPTGVGFGLDDHRVAHQDELDRRFAHELATHVARIIRETDVARAVVIASPHMLGVLRRALRTSLGKAFPLQSIALDLTRTSTPQLHDRLEALGLVPMRKRRSA